MSVTTWRYHLPALPHDGDSWSIVFIDSTGCLAVCSDYGDWCHRWNAQHSGYADFREFLAQAEGDYVARKLGSGRRDDLQQYDGEATAQRIRQHICEYRRQGSMTKHQARREWELVENSDVEHGDLVAFHDWYQSTELGDAYEFAKYLMGDGLKHWMTVSLPRLQAVLRAELAAEREAQTEGAAHGA